MPERLEKLLSSVRQGLEQAFPPAMAQLLKELVKPQPDFNDIAKVISLDPVLSAAVLNLVNSPFYSLSQKVVDLTRAAVVLGTKEILKIAISISYLKNQTQDSAKDNGMRYSNWRMVVWAAIAAELLAERLAPEETDKAYLSALLKDLSLLLLHHASPDILIQRPKSQLLTSVWPGQLEKETQTWGLDHGELTTLVLEEWGIPDLGGESIRNHHDLDNMDAFSPLTQAIILATKWSEIVNHPDGDPMSLVQFDMLFRSHLDFSEEEAAALQAICVQKFRSMLSILGIEEAQPDQRLYEQSVRTMQSYHVQTVEMLSISGGPSQSARAIARHLKWNFGITTWDLTLRVPAEDRWILFSTDDGIPVEIASDTNDTNLPWGITRKRLLLLASGEKWGELRIPPKLLKDDVGQEAALYTFFLARAYEQYCHRQAAMETKARTLDNLPIGVARLDLRGRLVEINKQLYKDLGSPRNPKGRDILECLDILDNPELETEWRLFLANPDKPAFSKMYCYTEATGPHHDRCLYLSAHKESRIESEGILLLAEDVNEISELEIQAFKQSHFMDRLIRSMRDIVLTLNENGDILFASPKVSTALVGKNLFSIAKPVGTFDGIWSHKLLENPPETVEVIIMIDHGQFQSLELVISPLGSRADTRQSYMVVARDLSAVRRLEEKIKRQAIYDGLTDLFNHYQFHAILEREVQRSRRTNHSLGLAFFDMDNFKEVNDTQGHQAGDEILKKTSQAIRDTIRKGTDYPCRYGGDEFAVIGTEIDRKGLESMAERINIAVQKITGGTVSMSTGLAMLTERESPASLLKRADKAAYKAKKQGGSRHAWS